MLKDSSESVYGQQRQIKACEEIMIIKVKFTLEQATKAQRGSRCITLLFL
jgi:hypothetical protein